MFRVKLRIAIPLRADFEQQDVESLVDQDVRGDAASRAGANNYRVINDTFLRHRHYTLVMLISWYAKKGDSQNTITYSGCPRLRSAFSLISECQFEPELHVASWGSACNRVITAIRKVNGWAVQVERVEGVEEVRLKLEPVIFMDGKLLPQREVPQVAAGAYDHAYSSGSAPLVWRRAKGRFIEPRH